MLSTAVHVILFAGFSCVQSSTNSEDAMDTCQGCFCANEAKYQDPVLSSSEPEHPSRHLSGDGGGHPPWWDKRYEREHFDAWVIIVLVLITLVFDLISHKLKHLAGEAGSLALNAHMSVKLKEKIHCRNLWQDLHARFSAEISVLGFLACVVWSCNQFGLFEALEEAEHNIDGVALPKTRDDYLHTTEEVHMHLFVTMCLYFMFLAVVIKMAQMFTSKAADANFQIKGDYENGVIKDGEEEAYVQGKDRFFKMFFLCRQYYFVSLQQWRGNWPFLDEHIRFLHDDLVKDAKMFETNVEHALDKTYMPTLMRRWFPFDLYAVLNYRFIMDELIEVKATTWLAIIFFLLTQGIMARFIHSNLHMTVSWAVWCQVLFATVPALNYYLYRQAFGTVKEGWKAEGDLPDLIDYHRIRPVRSTVRAIQIAMFFTFYEFASTIASRWEWENEPEWCVGYLLILLFAIPLEGLALGGMLPLYSVLMSSGPYMQESHVMRMQTIVKAMAKAEDKNTGSQSVRELAVNIEEFDEKAEHDEEQVQEMIRQESERQKDDYFVIGPIETSI